MRKLAPTRIRSKAYGHYAVVGHGPFWDYTATCRLCGDSCTFAGDDPKQDRKDALAWCYGHLAVYHPFWYQERCEHVWMIWKHSGQWSCLTCGYESS